MTLWYDPIMKTTTLPLPIHDGSKFTWTGALVLFTYHHDVIRDGEVVARVYESVTTDDSSWLLTGRETPWPPVQVMYTMKDLRDDIRLIKATLKTVPTSRY